MVCRLVHTHIFLCKLHVVPNQTAFDSVFSLISGCFLFSLSLKKHLVHWRTRCSCIADKWYQMYHNDSNISKEQNLIWRHQSEQIHTHTNGCPPHYLQIVHIQRVLIYLVVCKGHSLDIGVHESWQFHDSNDWHQSPIHRPPGLCTWHNLVDDQSSCYRRVMAHHKVWPKSTESKQ